MKLRNKLLPLLTVVSTTAIISPIITSCGNSSVETIDKNYTPTDYYKDATQEELTDGITQERALEIYCNGIQKNNDVFVQQQKYVYAYAINLAETMGSTDVSYGVSYKNIKFNNTNKTITFDITINSKGSYHTKQSEFLVTGTCTDIPIAVGWVDNKWFAGLDNYGQSWLDSTKIVGKATGSCWIFLEEESEGEHITFSGQQHTITKNTITSLTTEQKAIVDTILLDGPCYYLNKAGLKLKQ